MEGFSRLEIMLIDHTNLLVLLRWNNGPSFEKNLTHILNSCIMKDWFQLATTVRYQPVFIQSPKEHSAKEPIAT
ncbi:MAG: hypothetical protein K1X82_13550 [Bacteroidia bacterium]|nr:hypothetical protein [Bacteroidia bacterium]